MTITPATVVTAVAFLAWGTLFWRIYSGLRRPFEANPRERALRHLAWLANLCFALATTSLQPSEERLVQADWVQRIPLYLIALAATTALAVIAGEISPRHRQPTTRLVSLAVAAFGLFAALGLAIERGILSVAPYARDQGVWPALPFNLFVLWISARITRPAFWSVAVQERFRPMQIRLQTIAAHQALQILWQVVALLEFATVLAGLRLNFTWAFVAVGVPLVLLFVVYMGPRRVFVWAARVIDYLDNLVSYGLIGRLVQSGLRETTGALERRLLDLEETDLAWVRINNRLFAVQRLRSALPGWDAARRDPDTAVLQIVITLFDLRKTLRGTRTPTAQALARLLEPLAAPTVENHVLIRVLRGASLRGLPSMDLTHAA